MMYFDPGLIQPIELTDSRKQELACVMADAYRHLKRAATKRYGEADIRQLRTDWRTDRINLRADWQARDSMQNLERIEHEVIAGYIRIAHRLCKAFYYAHARCSSGVTMDDFVQEAAVGIFNAMYNYDGSTEFATYCYSSIKNQLVDFIRTDRMFSKMSRNVVLWRLSVIRLMNQQPDLGFDEALEAYQQQRIEKKLRALSGDEQNKIRAAYQSTHVVRDDLMEETLFVVVDDEQQADDLRELRVAINSEVLTESELAMVQRFLSGEKGWQTKMAQEEGVTRMAISLRWKKTQQKLREALLERKAA